MNASKNDSMLEALRRNRQNGLDITITIDAPEGVNASVGDEPGTDGLLAADNENVDGEQERRELDLAPNAELLDEQPHPDQDEDAEMIRQEIGKVGLGRKKQTF